MFFCDGTIFDIPFIYNGKCCNVCVIRQRRVEKVQVEKRNWIKGCWLLHLDFSDLFHSVHRYLSGWLHASIDKSYTRITVLSYSVNAMYESLSFLLCSTLFFPVRQKNIFFRWNWVICMMVFIHKAESFMLYFMQIVDTPLRKQSVMNPKLYFLW